jgi:hypothetical protein
VYFWSHWFCTPVAMRSALNSIVLLFMLAAFCPAESLTPAGALDRYLATSGNRQSECSDAAFAVQIDASLPNLRRQGSMSGFKVVSRTGQIGYRYLRFAGDSSVKSAVITRFLTNDTEKHQWGPSVTRENYSFFYERTSDYNGLVAYVFRLKPKRKRRGVFKGELWLDANTAAPLRLWGDLVKSPSIFIRHFRFVQDYLYPIHCRQPVRLIVTVQTRIVGEVELTAWFHSVESELAPTGNLVDPAASQASGH